MIRSRTVPVVSKRVLTLLAGALAIGACTSPEETGGATGASRAPLIGNGQYLYFRCNATDWNVTETSRVKATSDPNVFQLAIDVSQPWTLSDQCVFTLVTADQPDSWGTAQTNYTDSRPSSSLAVPGGDSLVGPQSSQVNLSVRYPGVGSYTLTVDWSEKTFTIVAASSPVDPGSDAAEDAASEDAGADATSSAAATEAGTGATDEGSDASTIPDPTEVVVDASTTGPDADAATPDASAASNGAADGAADDGADHAPPTGGYTIQCPWLLDPTTMLPHLLSSADFYVNVADPQFGGFFTYLDRQGNPKSTNKSFTVQSRDAYAFARAFMVSGNTSYLDSARSALDFLYAHGVDAQHGGFVFLGDQQGNWLPAPSGVPSDKWSFTQNYALAGPTALCEATQDPTQCDRMNAGMQLLESHYLDPTFGGYFNNANLDFSGLSEKGFTPTIDGLTPHIITTFLVTQNPSYRTRVVSLSDDAVNHLIGSMNAPGVVFGYPEFFNADWSIESGNTYGFIGHLYKTTWALARAYMITQDSKYRDAARTLLAQLWNDGGFDHTNGAPNFDYNFNSGVGSTNKEYWQIEQGFTSGITNWWIATSDADRAAYAEQADRSLCFFMRHMPDPQFGGIFFETSSDGSTLVGDGSDATTDKGDQWEGSYHNVELSYFAYLYGSLLLWQRPVTLYYAIDPSTADRTIALSPLEDSSVLVIQGATLGGQPYGDFDSRGRTLHLPAGVGGTFAVTYAYSPQ